MKLFIDANVLISVLNKEYPSFLFSARILSLPGKKYQLVTSAVCLAIVCYFAEKKHGRSAAKSKISLLLNHIDIVACGKTEALLAISNKKVHDFEDGLQYYAALNSKCNCIITDDTSGFYFSEIEIMEPEKFIRTYL